MCYILIGCPWLALGMCSSLQKCHSLIYVSFSDMMQGVNGNIKEVLGITSFTNYLAIYMIYGCVVVFCLYSETALHNNYIGYFLSQMSLHVI